MSNGEEISEGKKNHKILYIALGIAVIIIVILAAGLVLMGAKFGVIDNPFIDSGPMQVLVIGGPSADLSIILDQDKDLVWYRIKDPGALAVNPTEQLAQYDLVILDQHLGQTKYDKSVSMALGEAIENYVRTGGTLVTVMDSGIYRSGGTDGTEVASDVIGWNVNFGDIIPVECDRGTDGTPICERPISIPAKIYREDSDHKIMNGVEVAPSDPKYPPLNLITFDVKPKGKQIAYLKEELGPKHYPGILEKELLFGKSIYFNYDPAMTPGIWENTLQYLR